MTPRTQATDSLSRRLVRRLVDAPAPVRTSVLAEQLGVTRNRLWASLLRLERHGRVVRGVAEREGGVCRCPTCGRGKWKEGGRKEATWQLVSSLRPRTGADSNQR